MSQLKQAMEKKRNAAPKKKNLSADQALKLYRKSLKDEFARPGWQVGHIIPCSKEHYAKLAEESLAPSKDAIPSSKFIVKLAHFKEPNNNMEYNDEVCFMLCMDTAAATSVTNVKEAAACFGISMVLTRTDSTGMVHINKSIILSQFETEDLIFMLFADRCAFLTEFWPYTFQRFADKLKDKKLKIDADQKNAANMEGFDSFMQLAKKVAVAPATVPGITTKHLLAIRNSAAVVASLDDQDRDDDDDDNDDDDYDDKGEEISWIRKNYKEDDGDDYDYDGDNDDDNDASNQEEKDAERITSKLTNDHYHQGIMMMMMMMKEDSAGAAVTL